MPAKGWRKPPTPCSIEGCPRDAKKRGWCETHYACWRTTGNPLPQKRPHYGEKRRTTTQGYVEIFEPAHPLAFKDGYVLEHRKMAWDADMFDDPSLQVHHKDEVKTNNVLANFEVKTPSAHAREHLADRGYVKNQYGTWPLKDPRAGT